MGNSIILKPSDFRNSDYIVKNLQVEENKKSLVLGSVRNDEGNLVSEAIIIIYEQFFDGEFWRKRKLGFVTTNENGQFAMLLPKNNSINYVLEVFSPINCSEFC
ncbi:MAG: hypothetical protein ACRC7R_00655 [Sarcina sp.]